MLVIPANQEHSRQIAEVHVRACQQAYRGLLSDTYLDHLSIDRREEFWRDLLVCANAKVFVCEQAGGVTGFLSYRAAETDLGSVAKCVEITAFYVDPAHWRGGIGTNLWQTCRNHLQSAGCEEVSLWVVVSNQIGTNFYEKMGFEAEAGMVEAFELAGTSLLEQKFSIRLVNICHDGQPGLALSVP